MARLPETEYNSTTLETLDSSMGRENVMVEEQQIDFHEDRPHPKVPKTANAMEDVNDFYPISCENCRNKKSKCDRELPTCSQCLLQKIGCRYPPINKRGIPSGYLSYIEQRLLDTELLAIELLSAIYKSQIPILPQRLTEPERQVLSDISTKQPKSAKIEEWKVQPLSTDDDRHNWWLRRCEMISRPLHCEPNGTPQDIMTPQDTAYSPLTTRLEDMQPHIGIAMPPPAPIIPETTQPNMSWQPSPNALASPTNGIMENHSLARDRADSSSQGPRNMTQISSKETNRSNDSPSMSAERWRKYF